LPAKNVNNYRESTAPLKIRHYINLYIIIIIIIIIITSTNVQLQPISKSQNPLHQFPRSKSVTS